MPMIGCCLNATALQYSNVKQTPLFQRTSGLGHRTRCIDATTTGGTIDHPANAGNHVPVAEKNLACGSAKITGGKNHG